MNDNVRELTNEIAELEEGKNKVKAANDREIRVANATQAGNDYNRDMQKENNAEHIKALEKENDTLKNKNDALVKACNNKDDQVNALNRELSKARNSLQAAKVRCNGYEQEKKSKKQPTEKDA
jgi:chromosome segregation ATPase